MKRAFIQVALAAAALLCLSQAADANGINSPAGVDVQIGAGGNQIMRLTTAGLVGIGTATPHANLSVNGGVQIGTDTVCDASKEGTISYDSSAKQFKFCDGAKLQSIGDGEAGSYIMKDGACVQGNPLAQWQACACPTGYVAAAANESTASSGGPYIGYTCFAGSAMPTPGHWVQDSDTEQWSCPDTSYNSTPTPSTQPDYCNPSPLATPCTVGATGYREVQCDYGHYSDCVISGATQPVYGWSMGYYSYSCQ